MASTFRFRKYSGAELEQCGRALVRSLSDEKSKETSDWTQRVRNWLASHKAARVRVFGKPTSSELMLDQCHTSFPPATEKTFLPWDQALERDCRLLLAMECEWGSKKGRIRSQALILHDAWKLAIVGAKVKIMVFASQNDKDRGEIVERLKRLRGCARDDAPWLWVDVPWTGKTTCGCFPQ